eukprot:CAMPEP_0179116562 /NCGR_PEP_ID=MMETSP0796-20121207/54693_1 /TAXON_ID=73915 /ORGANISM="Pyrodinium bahamense, Strain pbaha01" /LENGTH=74 /DNA_ID=CAMNT_0020814875 /DNA_START=65 /DNA_END=289 /DNA_ORIENTATION=-
MACVKRNGEFDCNLVVSCVCGYLIPPVGMLCRYGCSHQFCIGTLLTLCGYVPGVIYAAYELGCVEPEDSKTKAE